MARRGTDSRASGVIRASEVGQYAFCARAWWLGSVEGQPSTLQEEMATGETAHRRHGQRVRASVTLRRTAYLLLALALLAAAIAVWQGV